MRATSLSLGTFALLVCMACFGPAFETSAIVVSFPDPNVENVVRQAINKPTGEILDTDLVGVGFTQFEYQPGYHVQVDLTGLEYCTDLQTVALGDYARPTDLAPLRTLINMKNLVMVEAGIKDLSPISNCTALRVLYMDYNSIADLTALESLPNLRELHLDLNLIRDLSPLVRNAGVGGGDLLFLAGNPLSHEALCEQDPRLSSRGVSVERR